MRKYVHFIDNKNDEYYIPIDYIKYLKSFYDKEYGKQVYCIYTEIGVKNVNEDNFRSLIRILGSDSQ